MPAKRFDRAYGANMSSLGGLELTCEADEGNLTAKLISLDLAKFEDGTKLTRAVYERDTGTVLGHLVFEEFTDDVDAGSRVAIHKAKVPTEPLVCKGQVFINNKVKNVVVFRLKASI